MIGFGTYKLTKDEAYHMTIKALKMGYRNIDTAELYNNEKMVQKAIVDSGINRDDIFLTTKISTKDPSKIAKSFMKRLRIFPKINLLLLHWPSTDHVCGWKILTELLQQYKEQVDNIGISNISLPILKEIIEKTGIVPYAIQNEINPFCFDLELETFCKNKNIKIIAHSCFSFGKALEFDEIKILANGNQITPANILLRWVKKHCDIYLTRCNEDKFLQENYEISESMDYIDIKSDKKFRLYYNK